MQNLAHLTEAIRQRLSEQDLELLDLASCYYARRLYSDETRDEEYDQIFDRVLARVRREEGPLLQRGLGLSP